MCGTLCINGDLNDEKGLLSSPLKTRGCTDIIPLLIFALFWGGMIFVAAFSINHGDAFRLVYGYDSFGNTCDEDNRERAIFNISLSGQNLKGRPYVFFMEVDRPWESMKICVNKCPDKELLDIKEIQQFSEQTGSFLCRYDILIGDYTQNGQSYKGPCPKTPLKKSAPLMNRCVPVELMKFHNRISSEVINFLNNSNVFQKVLTDLYKCWQEMFGLCFVALAFAVLQVLLIRYVASLIVWIILTVAVVASIAATSFLWWTYADLKSKLDEEETVNLTLLDVEIQSEKAFLVFSIIASILTIILLLVILILRRRISLVVTLFHEAGNCVSEMPCILVQPFWTFIVLILFFVYWMIILAYLSTSERSDMNDYGYMVYKEHETVAYFWWYHLIGLVWTCEFIIACEQLVISGAVATWYFSRDRENLGCTVGTSIFRLILYHLGSVAMGSFIITTLKFPRLVLMTLHKKLKASENQCAQFCTRCCVCCLWCLEKCLKYLNANAYTIIAISGKNFCTSAQKAFFIIMSNTLRVASINSVGNFVIFLGKVGVMAATGAIGIIWLKSRHDLHYFAIPVLLCCVFAYFIAHCFLSVFEMVMDALLLCFCEDCDLNDGSLERPYFASKFLMSYVEVSSKKLNQLTKKQGNGEEEPAQV